MAISLKEQLKQVNQLQEVSYHAPVFDKNYYDKSNHSEGQKNGKKMFYDFYAMEFLWSFLGSGQIPKAEREKMAMMDPDDPRRDIYSKTHRFIPAAGVNVIDSMYEQVTNTVAKNLLAYIRLAVVQEFQYLVSQSHAWSHFRQEIVTKYNMAKSKGVPFKKSDFDALVAKHIPEMRPYPESVKRLLKYSKYYSEMNTVDDQDPSDVTRKLSNKPDEEPTEFPSSDTDVPSMAPSDTDTEPDDTDYDAKPVRRSFGKYGGPGQPESPYKQDWSGDAAFNDAGDLPKIPADDDDDEEVKERLNEENINPSKVKKVYGAINKAGVTLDDIEKAYNKVPWGGSYGGPKWGAGAVALLKLTHAKKKLSTEDMNHIIDHIYDLQHNTGSLLNKGPMYIDDTDLNRRYKITDVARFIPFVSPTVKNLILRYYKYLTNDPDKAATETNMETLLRHPKIPFSPEEITQLTTLGFKPAGDNSYRVGIKFANKKGEGVHGVYYQVSKHEAGTFNDKGAFVKIPDDSKTPFYIVSDNLKADVKAFPEFDKAFSYVSGYKSQMNPSASVTGGYSAPAIKSEKDIYIDSHTKIKLTPDKEQQLLDINIGWRPKGKKYYKAYFSDGSRFHFYAFSDGSFLMFRSNVSAHFVYNNWPQAFEAAKGLVVGAQEYPEKAEAQAAITAALNGTPSTPSNPYGSPTPSSMKDYYLSSEETATLKNVVTNGLPQFIHDKYIFGNSDDGMTVVSRAKYHETKAKFAVGKHMDSSVKPYKVVHFLGKNPKESWTFSNWTSTIAFVTANLSKLVNAGLSMPLPISQQTTTQVRPSPAPGAPAAVTPSAYTAPSGKKLPPHSPTQSSYKAHVGIAAAPKNTIRLTAFDEGELSNIGFEPQMLGDDVWYMHKGTGDTVKFFPNNQAKVMFAGAYAGGKKTPSINGTIDKILVWLPTKYNKTVSKSPIQTGATVTPATTAALGGTPPTAPTPGIKAGTMFEKVFTDAGFVWDDMGGEYVDYPNKVPGEAHNTLKIAPNRSSVLTFVDGTNRSFKDLASLVAYIKNEYQAQKKSSSLNNASVKIKIFPSWMPAKMLELLEKGKFKYASAFHSGDSKGFGYKNVSGDEIIINKDGKSTVKDGASGYTEAYDTLEEVIQYLQEKYGSVPTINIHFEKALHNAGFGDGFQLKDAEGKAVHQFLNDKTGDTVYYNTDGTVKYVQAYPDGGHKTATFPNVYDATSYFNGVAFATPSESKTGVNALDSKLAEYGFEFAGPTSDGGSGTKKKGVVFDDAKKNRVIYYHDGNSIVYVNDSLSPKFGSNILLGDVYSLMNTLDEIFKEQPQPENKTTTLLPSSWDSTLKAAGFVEGTSKNQPCYNHSHDFLFKVFWTMDKYTIQWATETGVKEFTPPDIGAFLQVLTKVTPEMNGEQVDQLFSKQADGRREELLEPSGEAYKSHNDAANASFIILNDHDTKLLELCGFNWAKGENHYYKNPQGSIFSFYDNGTSSFYDNENGEIIKFDTITHALKFAVAKYVADTDPQVSAKKADTETQLNELGFTKQTPETMPGWFGTQVVSVYYNSKTTKIVQIRSDGTSGLYYKKPGDDTWSSEIIDKPTSYIISVLQTQAKPATSNDPSPFSNEDYNTISGDAIKPIALNAVDTDLLEKIGFHWNAAVKAYYKKLDGETPALEEAAKKKPKKKASTKPPIPQFQLPLDPPSDDDEQHYETINPFNNGWATWRWTKNPDAGNEHPIETKTLPIKDVLNFVWWRWSGQKKVAAVARPISNAGLSEKTTLKLKRLGFRWDVKNGWYVKRANTDDQEKIVVEDDDLVLYYVDPNGDTKKFGSTSSQAIVNKIIANQYNSAVTRLHNLGYVDLQHLMGPSPMVMAKSVQLFSEMYKEDSKELLQIFSDGSVRYGVFTKPGDISSFLPYTTFDSLQDAADHLAPKKKSITSTGQPVNAPGVFHKSLIEAFGFVLNDGSYVKGNQKIRFDAGGLVNYNYIGKMGEIVTYAQSWKDPDGINNLFLRLEANNPLSATPPAQTPNANNPPEVITTRVQASPTTHEELMNLSYLWDGHNLEYFNTNDYSKRIIFTSDGQIYYYPDGVSGEHLQFTSHDELLAKIKAKGKMLPQVSADIEKHVKERLAQHGFVTLGNNPHVAKFKNATTSHLVILDKDDGNSVLYVYDHKVNGMTPVKDFDTVDDLLAEYPRKTNNLQENYYKTLMRAMYQ